MVLEVIGIISDCKIIPASPTMPLIFVSIFLLHKSGSAFRFFNTIYFYICFAMFYICATNQL